MKRSTERILTTHVGSLPRPDDLIRTMFAKQEGVPVDPVALEERTRAAVAEIVAQAARRRRRRRLRRRDEQAELRHLHHRPPRRLRRHEPAAHLRRPRRLPGAAEEGLRRPRPHAAAGRPRATRRSRSATPRRPRVDVEHLKAALPRRPGGVPERRLAGRDRALLPQRPLRRPARSTSTRSPRRCGSSTRRSPTPASCVQIDCPDLAMGRHIQFADQILDEFRTEAQLNIEALNHATAQHRPRAAADARLLGQLRGPAPLRRAASRTSSTSSSARARTRSPSRPPTRATPTSGRSSRTSSCPTARS